MKLITGEHSYRDKQMVGGCLNAASPELAWFLEDEKSRKVVEVELSIKKDQKLADKEITSSRDRIRQARYSVERNYK